MPHKPNPKKLEDRIAKKIAFRNCKSAKSNLDHTGMREVIYTGEDNKIAGEVLAILKGQDHGELLEVEQGLVLAANNGDGYFEGFN